MGKPTRYRIIGRMAGAMLAMAGAACQPAAAQAAPQAMAIGQGSPGCRAAGGAVEALTCEGPDGWQVVIGYPAVGATLAFRRQDRPVPVTGEHWFPVEDVGDRRQPAVWLVRNHGGRRVARSLILPVVVLHPDDRRHLVTQGEPPARPRRSRVFLVILLSDQEVCLAAVADRSSGKATLSAARRAAAAIDSCPARPRLVGRASPTLSRVMAERR